MGAGNFNMVKADLRDVRNFAKEDFEDVCRQQRVPVFHAKQLFEWLYRKRVKNFDDMLNLPAKFRDYMGKAFYFPEMPLRKKEVSSDGTVKLLLGLEDGTGVESVFIPERSRRTICVSTQAGCRWGCNFCVSGLNGFERNLTAGEMVGQVLAAEEAASEKATNVVFMGVGEPLDNFDNLMTALDIMRDGQGLNMGKRKQSVSTCGVVPGIDRLAEKGGGIRLSVSLHSADDRKRSKIMPVNKKYDTGKLMASLKRFYAKEGLPVTFEYMLISGFNSSVEDAIQLSMYVKGVPHKLNIIPYNPSEYFDWKAPAAEEISDFTAVMKEKGVFFTVRKPRGRDINAACGLLKAQKSPE